MTSEDEATPEQIAELIAAVQNELVTLLQASGGRVPYADPFEGGVLLGAIQKACAAYVGPDFSQLKFEVGEVTPEMRRTGKCPPIHISGPLELMERLSRPEPGLRASDFIDVDVRIVSEDEAAEEVDSAC
jgi:hypothetical protein